ncbi:MAG: RNA pseudouridine synthase [Clostridia bacterium]|nr:RNA pseudouridine synthase [Clostridia bacterium]
MTEILFEDDFILICKKSAGTLSESSDNSESLPRIIENEYKTQGKSITLYTVHRLDREVSGVIVYAKDSETAKKLSDMMASRSFNKEYLAVVEGKLADTSGTLSDLLFRDARKNKSYVVDRKRKGVKEALLEYTVLDSRNDTTLVKIKLHTGRTHQIRVQFASRGHSILGDRKYGSEIKSKQIALCSHKIEFIHPVTRENISVSYSPPAIDLWSNYEDALKR